MNRTKFEILYALFKEGLLTQRELSEKTGISLGSINASLKILKEEGFVANSGEITEKGIKALQPFRVQNAVIMAAGLSSRFAPISFEKPKGILKVRGEVLIERQIKQLKEAGICDIIVVVGYKKEYFFYLEQKFGVKIVINNDFLTRNNNSTIKLVESLLGNTYICSSDNYFTSNPFEEYVFDSYYAAVYESGETQEWCLSTEGKNELITGATNGGANSWVMLGHSYWNESFSEKFISILNDEYDLPETANKLWESIYLEHVKELPMYMKKYNRDVIWEFDSLDELRGFDKDFINNVDSDILDNICYVLKCDREDISGFTPLKNGFTNMSFRFELNGSSYVYRHPGVGTEDIINRESETFSQTVASELNIDGTFIFEDSKSGWKLSKFIPDCVPFDYRNEKHLVKAMNLIRRLHSSRAKSEFVFDIHEDTKNMMKLIRDGYDIGFTEFNELYDLAEELNSVLKNQNSELVLCHNDFYDENLLVSKDRIHLIDWEFSAMSDYASDLGVFIACSDYSFEEGIRVFETYFQRELNKEELFHCIAYTCVVSFHWLVWALYKESIGDSVGDLLYFFYKHTKTYGKEAKKLLMED